MTVGDRPVYCPGCGSMASSGDRFCGTCGAPIPPDAQDAAPAREVPNLVPPPRNVPAEGGSRRALRWIVPVGLLIVIIAGTGALAYAALGPGGLLGASEPQPPEAEGGAPPREGRPEEASPPDEDPSVSPDAPPDPTFDPLLPALKGQTDAPIMLPAELPNELENVAIDADVEGDAYELVFLNTPPDDLVGTWPNYKTIGSLQAVPASEYEPDQRFEVASTEDVELQDGTEATLRYMQPVLDTAMFGPRWEGKFDKGGYTYTLSVLVSRDGYVVSKQALSTMVEVPGTGQTADTEPEDETAGSGYAAPGADDLEAEVEEAATEYYQAAGVEDWSYTYEHLDSETQSMFTEEEWFEKNQWFADNGSVVYHIESVELDETSEEPLVVEVSVRITGEDGSSFVRDTYWVLEDGEWLHRFGQEEYDSLMPGVPFEEFVAVQQ